MIIARGAGARETTDFRTIAPLFAVQSSSVVENLSQRICGPTRQRLEAATGNNKKQSPPGLDFGRLELRYNSDRSFEIAVDA